jgi:hypothetical protein
MGLVRSRWLGCGRVDPAGTTAEVEAMVGPLRQVQLATLRGTQERPEHLGL